MLKAPNVVKELKLMLKYIEERKSIPRKPQKNDEEYPWKQIRTFVLKK